MLVTLPVLLMASAFFSASETALFSLTRHQRVRLKRSRSLAAASVGTLLNETRDLLITLLLSNMTVNVLYFVVSTVLLIRMRRDHNAGALLMAVLTVAPVLGLIILGEVLPKLFATRMAMQWSQWAALPLLVVHRALWPVRRVLGAFIVAPLARLIAPRNRPAALSAEELQTLLDLSKQYGVIDTEEEHLLQQVLELSQLRVHDLMTPRVDMEGFDLNDDPSALIELIRRTRLSRIPVYVDDIDHIEGVIYARQALLRMPRSREDVKKLVRQVKFVPEQQRADQLLVDLRKTGMTFAIVVDEYGGTAGLVTLEDVVEHLVGHIAGPYDQQHDVMVEPVGPHKWRVSAALAVRDWVEAIGSVGWDARHAFDGVSTLGGLVMTQLGRLPREGDCTQLGNVVIEVERMDGRRVDTLLVQLQDSERSASPDSAKGGEA